jgi:hypothetical protein
MAKRFPCGFERVTISLLPRRQLVVGGEALLAKGVFYADGLSEDLASRRIIAHEPSRRV